MAEALDRESSLTSACETVARMEQEAAQRAKLSSLHDLSAAALSLRAKALHVLGRSEDAWRVRLSTSLGTVRSCEEAAKTAGEASQALQLAGAGADPKLAR